MGNELAALSSGLAAIVEQAGKSVVAVHARPRFASAGVILRPGIIVTAEHTVRQEDEITVTLPDGADQPATVVGSDSGTDIAVLKLADPAGETATLSSAQPRPGHLALAIGRSENSGVNATLGIISAVSGSCRTWRGGRLDQYIRLDLTMYPSSSGAAVIDTSGGVIGIATAGLSRIAGLAIPASTINRVADEILSRGHVARGYLGVGLQPVTVGDHLKSLIVLSVERGGPADKAGVLVGDIFVSLGGKEVSDTGDVQSILDTAAVGEAVQAGLLRGGEPHPITITLGERRGN